MWRLPEEIEQAELFTKHAKTVGIIFIVLGIIGALFPVFMSLTTVMFTAWLLIFSGFLTAFYTYKSDKSHWQGWLKSLVFFGVGTYMVVSPTGGIATLGLLFAVYFFADAFNSFLLAGSSFRGKGGWVWAINGHLSLLLGVLFVIGWPHTSVVLIGLFVGFSLFFDGIALLSGAKIFRKWLDDNVPKA